jgi:hypothetical protein
MKTILPVIALVLSLFTACRDNEAAGPADGCTTQKHGN